MQKWDKNLFDPTHLIEMNKPTILWGGNCYSSKLPNNPGWLAWIKIDSNNTKIRQSEYELAWTNFIKRSVAYRSIWIGAGKEGIENSSVYRLSHPCQKPVGLMVWCIKLTKYNNILDPYMGSGTTGVACAQLNRSFIGIEISEEYCNIAVERIKRELSQPRFEFEKQPEAHQESLF